MSGVRIQKPLNMGRHAAGCGICNHSHKDEIERDLINRKSPTRIAKEYGLKDRSSVYRHAHALGLRRRFRAVDGVGSTAPEIEQKAYDLGKSRGAKFGRLRQHEMELA